MNCPDPSTCTNLSTDQIKQLVVNYAYGYRIDPQIALAQINRESGFNPCCVGGDGERGLAQILDTTWPTFAPAGVGFDQAFDPDYNLTTWGNYMSYLSGLFGGDMTAILQAYNGGPGHVQKGNVSQAAQGYAAAIIAAAGSIPGPHGGGENATGAPPAQNMWLILGGLALLMVFAARD